MRYLIASAILIMSFTAIAQTPSVVVSPLDHLFIPAGFDNNDNVELVVTGKFPNPCYTRNKVEVVVKDDVINATITSLLQTPSDSSICEDLKISFSETVTVGNLQAGNYKIIVNEGTRSELKGELEVAVSASHSVDDHIYAQIDHVNLGFAGGITGDALLIGYSPSPCLVVDKVVYRNNGMDTYSILPIMKKISNVCPEIKTQIEIPIKFNVSSVKNETILLFVRSIEGKSIQAFINK